MVKLLSCASASTAGFCCRLQSGQLCLEAPTIKRRQQGLADLADAAKQAAATLSDRPPYCLSAALRGLSPARQSRRVSILDSSAGSSHSSCVWQGHLCLARPPSSKSKDSRRGDAADAVQQPVKLSQAKQLGGWFWQRANQQAQLRRLTEVTLQERASNRSSS